MDENEYDRDELIGWIHEEIAARGTSSVFYGRGLDPITGEYDAEEIATGLIAGSLRIQGVRLEPFRI